MYHWNPEQHDLCQWDAKICYILIKIQKDQGIIIQGGTRGGTRAAFHMMNPGGFRTRRSAAHPSLPSRSCGRVGFLFLLLLPHYFRIPKQ